MQNNFLSKLWIITVLCIFAAYFFIDRPLADFIHQQDWRAHLAFLRVIVEWPFLATGIAPFLLLIMLCCKGHQTQAPKWQRLLIVLSISVLFAFVLKNELKWVFSRYWPETWINNNPSWIQNHAYGFRWFQGNILQGMDATGSFPSGHSTIAFASLLPIGLYYRRLLWICILLASCEALSMIAFNYHFLSDVLAGSLLGSTCAILCARYDLSR